jgi:hypothetical protein
MAFSRKPSLEDKILELKGEIATFIDAKAAEIKETTPNVPLQVIRNIICARPLPCECGVALKLLQDEAAS